MDIEGDEPTRLRLIAALVGRRRVHMSDEVWIEKGKGRTLSINVRLFKDKIAEKRREVR